MNNNTRYNALYILFFLVICHSEFFAQDKTFDSQNCISVERKNNSLLLNCDKSIIEIKAIKNDIIKVIFHDDFRIECDSSYGVLEQKDTEYAKINEFTDRITFETDDIRLLIDKRPLSLKFYRGNKLIISDTSGGFYRYEKYDYKGVKFALKENENIYGLGSRALPVNKRNQRAYLNNVNRFGYEWGRESSLNMNIPFLVSSENYALLFDNHMSSIVQTDIDGKNILNYTTLGGKFSYFVIFGDDFSQIYKTYTELTGRQPLPPRWVLGYIQSRSYYNTDEEVRQVFDSMKTENFPVDAVVFDLSWFTKMGDFEWRNTFSAPDSFIREFRERGIDFVLIGDLYISPYSKYYDEVLDKKLCTFDSAGNPTKSRIFSVHGFLLLDLTNPETRDWWWEIYRKRTAEGIQGWWCDGGEPDEHPPQIIHYNGKSAAEMHNVYSNIWLDMLYKGYQRDFPDIRPAFFCRAGWTGIQRYGPLHLCGDEARSWGALKGMIPVMLSSAMSGISYLHSDAGGYAPRDHDFHNELYIRWLQLGTFSPVMRVHLAGPVPAEPIFYIDTVKTIVRKMAEMRYQLLPYNYTCAYENSSTGLPIMKPINFYEPKNSDIANINDEFLWGENLLVAPVVDSVYQREVFFPKGKWIDFFDGKKYEGDSSYSFDVPLDRLPLFVKSGSFIPMAPKRMNTKSYNADTLIIRYYPAEDSSETYYTLFNDDGKSPNSLESNSYELVSFNGSTNSSEIQLRISDSGFTFPSAPKQRNLIFRIFSDKFVPGSVDIENKKVNLFKSINDYLAAETAAYYDAESGEIFIRFNWDGTNTRIMIKAIIINVEENDYNISSNQPEPNPFAENFTINYLLKENTDIELSLYSISGQRVFRKSEHNKGAGIHSFCWSNEYKEELPIGIYVLRILDLKSWESKNFKIIKK